MNATDRLQALVGRFGVPRPACVAACVAHGVRGRALRSRLRGDRLSSATAFRSTPSSLACRVATRNRPAERTPEPRTPCHHRAARAWAFLLRARHGGGRAGGVRGDDRRDDSGSPLPVACEEGVDRTRVAHLEQSPRSLDQRASPRTPPATHAATHAWAGRASAPGRIQTPSLCHSSAGGGESTARNDAEGVAPSAAVHSR